MELKEDIYNKVTELSARGDELAAQGLNHEAGQTYTEALELLPAPLEQWEAAGWLLTALGDVNFLDGNFEAAVNFLYDALNCPDMQENPFVHLRLGQSLLQINHSADAASYLLKAYMLGGDSIFEGEDPLYFEIIKQTVE